MRRLPSALDFRLSTLPRPVAQFTKLLTTTRLRWITASLLLALIVAATLWLRKSLPASLPVRTSPPQAASFHEQIRTPTAAPRIFTPENSRPAERTASGVVLIPEHIASARHLHAPETTVHDDLQILQSILEGFRRVNDGANPVGGLNEEIVEKLCGKNPKRVAVFPVDHPSIDSEGRLRDRWGTPYFFHPVSRTLLEIRSAGPDGKLWTNDDVEVPQ
jgi:hypothetical protein